MNAVSPDGLVRDLSKKSVLLYYVVVYSIDNSLSQHNTTMCLQLYVIPEHISMRISLEGILEVGGVYL